MLLPGVQAVPVVAVASSAINRVTGPPNALIDPLQSVAQYTSQQCFLCFSGLASDVFAAGAVFSMICLVAIS